MFISPTFKRLIQRRRTGNGAWVWGFIFLISQHVGAALAPSGRIAELPFYVYGDESGALSRYVPSGFMGDTNSLSSLTSASDESAPASTGRAGHTSLKIEYTGKGKQGWAGIYWLAPANNWGTIKGAGYDLSGATKLTFWIRGEKGGEKISQIKIGGVNGPYPDSDQAFIGPLTLSKEWAKHEIDLKGKDLKHIVGGFMFVIRRVDNSRGASFYLNEIVFTGNTQEQGVIEAENAVSTASAISPPQDLKNKKSRTHAK